MKTSILFVCLILLLTFACNNEAKTTEHDHSSHDHATDADTSATGKLFQEVMAVHDEVMPKMDNLMALKKQTKLKIKELDSLAKANPKLKNETEKKQLDSLLVELDEADNSMMGWMNDFDTEMNGKTETQKLEYLKSEKVKIDEVKTKMLSSLEKAGKILKK